LNRERKDTRKTSESIAVATVSLFDDGNFLSLFNPDKGAADFCVWTFNPLGRSFGYARRGF
jgi:hypothetical protein